MIDIRLRAFIPSPAVSIPLGPLTAGFGGDGRGFSPDSGTSRAEIWVNVDNSPAAAGRITVNRLGFGETTRYSMDKIIDIPGKPGWWKDVKRDPFLGIPASPDSRATAEVTESTLSVHGSLEQDPFGLLSNARVKFHVVGFNPLEPIAFPLNCDLDILVAASGLPLISYSVSGSHDGFPAYELYIQGRRVYSFDPVAAGTSPLSLIASGDISVNIPTTVLI